MNDRQANEDTFSFLNLSQLKENKITTTTKSMLYRAICDFLPLGGVGWEGGLRRGILPKQEDMSITQEYYICTRYNNSTTKTKRHEYYT